MIYNSLYELLSNMFWETATQMVTIVVPIIGIMIIFKLIYDAVLKEK